MGTFTKSFGSGGGYIAGNKVSKKSIKLIKFDVCTQYLLLPLWIYPYLVKRLHKYIII